MNKQDYLPIPPKHKKILVLSIKYLDFAAAFIVAR